MSKKPTEREVSKAVAVMERAGCEFPTPEVAERRFAETVNWARRIWRNKRTRRCNAQYPAFLISRVQAAAVCVRMARAAAA